MLQGAVSGNVEAQVAAEFADFGVAEGVKDSKVETGGDGAQIDVAGYPGFKSARPT